MSKKKLICCICNLPIPIKVFPNGQKWAEGNNAEPVAQGRCCDACNDTVVLPARLGERYLADTFKREKK